MIEAVRARVGLGGVGTAGLGGAMVMKSGGVGTRKEMK